MPDSRRDQDPRLRRLADEQAALRRVATLVARGVSPDELFSAVSDEVGRLFGSAQAAIGRYEPDGSSVVYVGISQGLSTMPIGTRWPLEDFLASTTVYRTGRPARQEQRDYETATGEIADTLRELNTVSRVGAPILVEGKLWGVLLVTDTHEHLPPDSLRQMNYVSTVAAPITVEGRLWGVMTVSDQRKPLPPDTEKRVANFTELVATAIADSESRSHLEQLASEQAALRRVATLVAQDVPASELFSAVAREVGTLFGADFTAIVRYEPDPTYVTTIATWAAAGNMPPAPSQPRTVPGDPTSRVAATGEPTRVDDWSDVPGPIAEFVRDQLKVRSSVGCPIVVEGRLWGALAVHSTDDRFPPDTEARLLNFCELVATAIANAESRAELGASRARVIAAADDARRLIERDLHDGAQQRLVTLSVALRTMEATMPTGSDEQRAEVGRIADGLAAAVQELRELSRGIHPAVLTQGGLAPALKALRRRSPVRVTLDIPFERRLRRPGRGGCLLHSLRGPY